MSNDFSAIDAGPARRYHQPQPARIPASFHVAAWMLILSLLAAWVYAAFDIAVHYKRRAEDRQFLRDR